MTSFYVSKPVMDALYESLKDDYKTYLQDMATTSGMKLDAIKLVKISNDYAATGLQKPCILMDIVSCEIEDEGVGIVGATLMFEVVFIIEGMKEDDLTYRTMLYADALVSMVTSDDYLGGDVVHASVPRIEYYPGGTGTTRYAVADVEITYEIERS
jgi:hypothetical protein